MDAASKSGDAHSEMGDEREAVAQRAVTVRRMRFSLKRMFIVISVLGVVFACAGLFMRSPFYPPSDAARVLVDCGTRDLDFMCIVAIDGDEYVALSPYNYMFTYHKMEGGGLLTGYDGVPLGRDSDILVEWKSASRYSFLAQDTTGQWHLWNLDDSTLNVAEGPFRRTVVTITIPDDMASEEPAESMLTDLKVPWLSTAD